MLGKTGSTPAVLAVSLSCLCNHHFGALGGSFGLSLQLLHAPLQCGDLGPVSGHDALERISIRTQLLAGQAGDLFFKGLRDVGHAKDSARQCSTDRSTAEKQSWLSANHL